LNPGDAWTSPCPHPSFPLPVQTKAQLPGPELLLLFLEWYRKMSFGVAGRAWEGMDRLMGARGFKLKCQNTPLVMALSNFCEIILFHGHKISWFDDERHVRFVNT